MKLYTRTGDDGMTMLFAGGRVAKTHLRVAACGTLDELNAPLTNFILPGGVPAAAALHVARTVCRRAERLVVALQQQEPVGPQLLPCINRLSDLLFTLARHENHVAGRDDEPWLP